MKPIFSLGIMTGTSADGADLALIKCGNAESLIKTKSAAFPTILRKRILTAQRDKLTTSKIFELNRDYSMWIGGIATQFLKHAKLSLDNVIISVHGQTVWHSPPKSKRDIGYTVQLLDPSIVSLQTGCTVISGFRQPDMARNGQGAPLVPYYHWIRSHESKFRNQIPFAIHNTGGISNLTLVTPQSEDMIAFDTGPANCLIDLAVEKMTKNRLRFDSSGKIAASKLASIDWDKIIKLGNNLYFKKNPPKSTGRELFNDSFLGKIPGNGPVKVANATAFSAYTMAKAYADFITPDFKIKTIFICGGGAKNPTLIHLFQHLLHELTGLAISVQQIPDALAPSQFVEAMAFARLGVEAITGKPVSLKVVTGANSDAFGANITPGMNYKNILKIASSRA